MPPLNAVPLDGSPDWHTLSDEQIASCIRADLPAVLRNAADRVPDASLPNRPANAYAAAALLTYARDRLTDAQFIAATRICPWAALQYDPGRIPTHLRTALIRENPEVALEYAADYIPTDLLPQIAVMFPGTAVKTAGHLLDDLTYARCLLAAYAVRRAVHPHPVTVLQETMAQFAKERWTGTADELVKVAANVTTPARALSDVAITPRRGETSAPGLR